MSLILAIVIGVILLSRFSFDKVSYKEAQKNIQENIDALKLAHEIFYKKYSDEELELKYAEEAFNCCVYGSGSVFAERIKQEIIDASGIEPKREMVLMGMMAESCKIPRKFINQGISSPLRLNSMQDWQFTDYSKKYLAFLKWYNSKLKSYGMPHDLLYVKSTDDNRLYFHSKRECWTALEDVDNPRYQGVYTWWEARMYANTFGTSIL